jgi:hypothetical protein
MARLLLPTLHPETGSVGGSASTASHESGFASRRIKGAASKKQRTGETT